MEENFQNLSCDEHEKRKILFLGFNKDEKKNQLYCAKCIQSKMKHIQEDTLVEIEDLQKKENVKDIINWPEIKDIRLKTIIEGIQEGRLEQEKKIAIQKFSEEYDSSLLNLVEQLKMGKKEIIILLEQYFTHKQNCNDKFSKQLKMNQYYQKNWVLELLDKLQEKKDFDLKKFNRNLKQLSNSEELQVLHLDRFSKQRSCKFEPLKELFINQIDCNLRNFLEKCKNSYIGSLLEGFEGVYCQELILYQTLIQKKEPVQLIQSNYFHRNQHVRLLVEFFSNSSFSEDDDEFSFYFDNKLYENIEDDQNSSGGDDNEEDENQDDDDSDYDEDNDYDRDYGDDSNYDNDYDNDSDIMDEDTYGHSNDLEYDIEDFNDTENNIYESVEEEEEEKIFNDANSQLYNFFKVVYLYSTLK